MSRLFHCQHKMACCNVNEVVNCGLTWALLRQSQRMRSSEWAHRESITSSKVAWAARTASIVCLYMCRVSLWAIQFYAFKYSGCECRVPNIIHACQHSRTVMPLKNSLSPVCLCPQQHTFCGILSLCVYAFVISFFLSLVEFANGSFLISLKYKSLASCWINSMFTHAGRSWWDNKPKAHSRAPTHSLRVWHYEFGIVWMKLFKAFRFFLFFSRVCDCWC